MAQPVEVKALFRAFLRYGSRFPNYNIREYVKRKAKEVFRAHQEESDPQMLSELLKKARSDLEVVQRQSVVYSMYARKHKSIMDIPFTQVLQDQKDIPSEQLNTPSM